jgi:hypothetical protein
MKRLVYLLFPAFLLSGCAGNVKNLQCSGVDWRDYGYKTAKSGKSVRVFDKYRDGCGEKLEEKALASYLEGYSQGIAEFCTYQNGYDRGFANQDLGEVCPVEMRTEYEKGHKVGLFELREKIKAMERINDDTETRGAADRSDSGMESQ